MKKEDRYDIPKIYLENESFLPFLQAVCTAEKNNYDFLRKLGEILTLIASNAAIGKINIENLIQGIEKLASREEAIAVLGATTAANHFVKTLEKEPVVLASDSTAAIVSEIDKHLVG
jgi:hypothetical protein